MPRSIRQGSSLLPIFGFEIRHHLRQPLFYLVTFFLSVLLFLDGSGQGRGGATGKLLLNAPAVVLEHLMTWIHVVLFLMAAFVVSAAMRDFDRRTSELFFSKPVSRFDYLIGRFAGAIVACLLPYLVGAVAFAIGTSMPDIAPERVGPFRLAPYAFAFGVLILPTLLALGGAFFALAIWTRSTIATYVGIVAFVALSAVAGLSSSQLVSPWIGQMLDPFGVTALGDTLRHWTTAELNTAIPPLGGMLLWNRVLWLGLGLSAFGIASATFVPAQEPSPARRSTSPVVEEPSEPQIVRPSHAHSPQRTFSWHTVRIQFLRQTWREVLGVLGSLPFLGMLLLGLIVLIETASSAGNIFGMPVYPRTHLMIEAMQGGFAKVLLLAAVLFSGELVWRDRTLDVHEMVDALPTPNGVLFGAKLVALLFAIAVFQLAGVVALIAFQLLQGYAHLEFGLYVQGMLIAAAYPVLMMVLSSAFHVVARNRIAGYGLVVLFIVAWDLLEEFGFEHHLYRYASLPPTPYSDLNGFGHFLQPFSWYALYWGLVATMLIGVSVAFWRRGTDDSWRSRLSEARTRFHGLTRAVTVTSVLGATMAGAWIFYNTNVLNEYVPNTTMAARRALYETRYVRYQNINLPRVVAVRGEVDIYPRDRRVNIRGSYRLQNQSTQPQRDIHVSIPVGVHVNRLGLPSHDIVHADDTLGYHILQLHTPLAPNDSLELGFDLVVENEGFVNNGASVTVVENGTYFTKRDFFPVIGFEPQRQLVISDERKEHGLDPLPRLADPDDAAARSRSPRASDADRVAFDMIVSTDLDQTAITSGELLRSWAANGRRYFHYRTDIPITHYFGFVSARYAVKSSEQNGVAIEIYHHPEHRENIDRMMQAAGQSLGYYTENFGPYQHRSLRVVEFPLYARDATSLPGFISFSESMGFNARLGNDATIFF
ncbi:MAG: ABC transporter permease subunit, partial [Gemmatimonadaceae bacterium]|nr:ABC transporter permease subunit [Gemmatimonadaceae bacterium]